ncbi:DUF397 domain-containing protein [Streptomyces ipomoeae]|uniref:DUF397 domain-containing protein n=1 Tax=Streptomyces ipomoeae TaxID=103232 RepID=UPI0015F01FB6|nr:DUF397 domain-containing protein [Streptomyces ipomoeae]
MEGDHCVEVAACPSAVHVRDSKLPASPEPSLSPASWTPSSPTRVTSRRTPTKRAVEDTIRPAHPFTFIR